MDPLEIASLLVNDPEFAAAVNMIEELTDEYHTKMTDKAERYLAEIETGITWD